ncbi:hypothetical protein XENOCAPTIV_017309 [Xenoophorus captivus]|uniref:Uncharacterized protein n=1 Tax=Xenoophorus captivus TaxID=1517983 RepID=A0ABV0RHZ1_9TELE
MLGQAQVRSISTRCGFHKVSHRLHNCNETLRRGLKVKGDTDPEGQTASVLARWLKQFGCVTTAYDTVCLCVFEKSVKGVERRWGDGVREKNSLSLRRKHSEKQ